MEVPRKDIIRTWILPHLSTGTRGPAGPADLLEVVETILYKLKTGCQWRQLPIDQFFNEAALTWQGVYYHFNEWRKDGSWKKLWVTLLHLHEARLDLSSIQLEYTTRWPPHPHPHRRGGHWVPGPRSRPPHQPAFSGRQHGPAPGPCHAAGRQPPRPVCH